MLDELAEDPAVDGTEPPMQIDADARHAAPLWDERVGIERRARAMGVSRVRLGVRTALPRLRAYYERCGYPPCAKTATRATRRRPMWSWRRTCGRVSPHHRQPSWRTA